MGLDYGVGPVYRKMNRPKSRSLPRMIRSPFWSSARATPQKFVALRIDVVADFLDPCLVEGGHPEPARVPGEVRELSVNRLGQTRFARHPPSRSGVCDGALCLRASRSERESADIAGKAPARATAPWRQCFRRIGGDLDVSAPSVSVKLWSRATLEGAVLVTPRLRFAIVAVPGAGASGRGQPRASAAAPRL